MLESVVENVQLGVKFLFGELACAVAAFADDNGNSQLAGDEQRLVAKIGGAALGIHDEGPASFAAVAAGEHVEGDAAGFELFAEGNDKGGFARTADGEISNAD